jgi:UrcA family protein
MNSRISVLIVLCLSLSGATAACAAESPSQTRRQVVAYADLNLSTRQGAATLYSRIRAAANQVCPTSGDSRTLTELTRTKNCLDRAIAQAVGTVGNSNLTQLYLERSGVHQQLIARVSH